MNNVESVHILKLPTGFSTANNISGTVGECQQILDGGGFCFCLEFLPSDNLDYIELLAKKKGLISDKEDNI